MRSDSRRLTPAQVGGGRSLAGFTASDLGVGGIGAGVRVGRVLSQEMTTGGGRHRFMTSLRAIKPPAEGSLWPIKLTEGNFSFYDLLPRTSGSVLRGSGNISSSLVRS